MKQCLLTTVDNPYNPFENFDEWFAFDVEKGYYSCSRLMRIAKVQDDFNEVETNNEIERAIDDIIKYDFTDKYQKAEQETIETE